MVYCTPLEETVIVMLIKSYYALVEWVHLMTKVLSGFSRSIKLNLPAVLFYQVVYVLSFHPKAER